MAQIKRVLIVDDERPIRKILTRWLTGWGYGVRDVGSAVEALNVMAADPADIVLCDIKMPEHDGLWLAEQLHAQWPQTAIIMSTGRDDPQTVRRSRELGAVVGECITLSALVGGYHRIGVFKCHCGDVQVILVGEVLQVQLGGGALGDTD